MGKEIVFKHSSYYKRALKATADKSYWQNRMCKSKAKFDHLKEKTQLMEIKVTWSLSRSRVTVKL